MDLLATISSDRDINLLPDILSYSKGVGLLKAESFLLQKNCSHPKHNIIHDLDSFKDLYVEELINICRLIYPKTVRFRLSDLKSSEALHLVYGAKYEKSELNPALGYRGLFRLISENYVDLLKLEVEAICKVRLLGYSNLNLCLPFVRTYSEFENAIEIIRCIALNCDIQIWIMLEVPSNLFDLKFLEDKSITGFIIGTSDLYQLLFAKDRDSSFFIEKNDEELKMLTELIIDFAEKSVCFNKKVSVAGFLLEQNQAFLSSLKNKNIESICLNPRTLIKHGQKI